MYNYHSLATQSKGRVKYQTTKISPRQINNKSRQVNNKFSPSLSVVGKWAQQEGVAAKRANIGLKSFWLAGRGNLAVCQLMLSRTEAPQKKYCARGGAPQALGPIALAALEITTSRGK